MRERRRPAAPCPSVCRPGGPLGRGTLAMEATESSRDNISMALGGLSCPLTSRGFYKAVLYEGVLCQDATYVYERYL